MSDFRNYLNEQLQRPSFKAEWDALQPELTIAQAMIDARKESGLTQKQLSERTGIAQADIRVLAMAMALGVTASAYAANPFSDVPAGHWAYDSVNKLAAAGIVDGYGNGTFGGDRLMTRYEMAQIVAKAMAKGANVDRLAAEFADELDSLGVRVAALEKKSDNVKITGEVRYHYQDNSGDADGYSTKLRSRIWMTGQINDDWKYTGMLENNEEWWTCRPCPPW